ncbi:myrosinase 5-like [Carica papaya]|uniref:myrosinase 5-like n=1 Tax=Carica papaya TaxID=3649 RepID=UPI000B8C8A70|nr:myrosinase 5-like [Carica papaya]
MTIQGGYQYLFLLVLVLSSVCINEARTIPFSIINDKDIGSFKILDENSLNCRTFPNNFVWGTATSAFQIEGVTHRAFNIWDSFTHTYPEKSDDGSTADLACDSYHLYKVDVEMMKNMNVTGYRFSIAWSRVLPKGRISGGINRDGIQYYNNLIDELLAKEIEPFVTIFHWDLPQTLQDMYGGFLDRNIVSDYRDFANFCFKEFGDKVKHWITFNQPYSVAYNAYGIGEQAPGRCSAWMDNNCTGGHSGVEPYVVAYHELLAHAEAVQLYKREYKELRSEGSNISGYFAWSLIDNYEFGHGFTVRFGLNYVNYSNPSDRLPKASALWFTDFINNATNI